ncbi:hypothetical protein ACIRUY_32055 [Streptomyces erythrochromogenes]|uniref:hypothetical protein n=2 Tax=Streptomyces erythrochromogenes TaxID=285574 RepID=UPI003800CDA7
MGAEANMLAMTKAMPEDEASRARKEMTGHWMRAENSAPSMKGPTALGKRCQRPGGTGDV